jgi:hypothetical protein
MISASPTGGSARHHRKDLAVEEMVAVVDVVGVVVTAVHNCRPIARRIELYRTWGPRFRDQVARFGEPRSEPSIRRA